jgi:hypothetical protein
LLTRRRLAAVFVVVLIAALVALAVSSFVWAKSYAPLRVTAYGPGFGVSERPVGSNDDPLCAASAPCGHLAFVIHGDRTRIAEFHLVVKNDGRWPITIRRPDLDVYCTRVVTFGNCLQPEALRRAPPRSAGAQAVTAGRFRPLRVAARASADLWVRFAAGCQKHEPGYGEGAYTLPLVYRYLGHFERTQNVPMPFDVVYIC